MKRVDYPAIYVIRNILNGKVYVGSSLKVLARMVAHKHGLNRKTHRNVYLQNAWDKHGSEGFSWEIVERCTEGNRLEREQAWIDKLKAADRRHGYNVAYPVRSLLPSPAMSAVSAKSWQDPATRANRQAGLDRAWSGEFRNRKAADLQKGREAAWARWDDPIFRAEQSAIRSAQWDNPEWRAAREAELKVKNAKAHTPEAKAKRSATLQALWTPEHKAKHAERLARNAREMTRKRMEKRAALKASQEIV